MSKYMIAIMAAVVNSACSWVMGSHFASNWTQKLPSMLMEKLKMNADSIHAAATKND